MEKPIMKKPIIAALIAILITACVGAAMFTIGGAALLNKNGTTAANSPAQSVQAVSLNTAQQSDQVAQLQGLISQYQDHEKQYQQREQQLQDQLSQANAQIQSDQQTIQQAQSLVEALQERGIIRISNGRIFLNQ
jgi:peptidoglycan hydrolase CwlO-like protein